MEALHRQAADLRLVTGQEEPAVGRRTVTARVLGETRRRVALRIDAERHELDATLSAERLVEPGELRRHHGTARRAVREDEVRDPHRALQVAQVHAVAGLRHETEVGQRAVVVEPAEPAARNNDASRRSARASEPRARPVPERGRREPEERDHERRPQRVLATLRVQCKSPDVVRRACREASANIVTAKPVETRSETPSAGMARATVSARADPRYMPRRSAASAYVIG